MLATGLGILLGQQWARLVGVLLVALNMVSQLMLMPAYPFWSLAIIAVDVVVVWALLNHADEIPGA